MSTNAASTGATPSTLEAIRRRCEFVALNTAVAYLGETGSTTAGDTLDLEVTVDGEPSHLVSSEDNGGQATPSVLPDGRQFARFKRCLAQHLERHQGNVSDLVATHDGMTNGKILVEAGVDTHGRLIFSSRGTTSALSGLAVANWTYNGGHRIR